MDAKPRLDPVRTASMFLFAVIITALSQWSIDRFWLYHSQNRILHPSDYSVRVLPLSEQSVDHQLSDDGRYAVEVMTNGTSHAMDQVTAGLLPVGITALIGLAFVRYSKQKHAAKSG
jgi:hypothetical protein